MPCSDPVWIETFARKVIRDEPKSVLDIGIGFGLGGMLARQYGDAWWGRYRRKDWMVKVDGIELFEAYVMPHHLHLYDTIYVGNALDVLPKLGTYDLILCADTIEHLKKTEGGWLMDMMAKHAPKYLITTPNVLFDTVLHGNPGEAHQCLWAEDELAPRGEVTRHGDLFLVER